MLLQIDYKDKKYNDKLKERMNNTYIGILSIFVIILIYLYSKSTVSGIETFYTEINLSTSKISVEKHPEYLLPSNNTASDPGSEDGEDFYKDMKINAYVTPGGKIIFDSDEIKKNYERNTLWSPSKKTNEEETEDSMLARFMIPILWQATKKQMDSFSSLGTDIEKLTTILRSANKKMIGINETVKQIGPEVIDKKRADDFDFKKF